jgi:hypothetical protein
MQAINTLQSTVDRRELVPKLGAKADAICFEALQQFSSDASERGSDAKESVFLLKVLLIDQ